MTPSLTLLTCLGAPLLWGYPHLVGRRGSAEAPGRGCRVVLEEEAETGYKRAPWDSPSGETCARVSAGAEAPCSSMYRRSSGSACSLRPSFFSCSLPAQRCCSRAIRKPGSALVIGAAALMLVGGLLPLSTWLIFPLEERFPRADLARGDVDGIVVLGGAEDPHVASGAPRPCSQRGGRALHGSRCLGAALSQSQGRLHQRLHRDPLRAGHRR